jgi:hypothetical protein
VTAHDPNDRTGPYLTAEDIKKAIAEIEARPTPPILLHPEEYKRHKAEIDKYEEMVRFKRALDDARAWAYKYPIWPVRIEVTRDVYDSLKATLSKPPYDHLGVSHHMLTGVPVVIDPDVPEPGWRFVYPEEQQ